MATRKLTARFVETVRTDQEREDIADGVVRGLQLRVTSQGSKTWAVRYTRTSDGRRRRLTLGSYPSLSLEEARLRAREELSAVARGVDPAGDKQEHLKADTFEGLSASWLARYARPNKVPKAVYDDELMLRNDILPIIGATKVEAVSKRDIVRIINAVAEKGLKVRPNRVLALVKSIFRWGVSEDLIVNDPTQGVRRRVKERARDRVLSANEIRHFWHTLGHAPMSRSLVTAIRIALVTAARIGEVSCISRSELDLTPGKEIWTLPARRSKNKEPHALPLSRMAVVLIEEAIREAGDSAFLFPSPSMDKPIDAHAATRAMSRARAGLGIDNIRLHDLRRSASTHMASLGVAPHVIERILNHTTGTLGGVTGVYNRFRYLPEMRAALDLWARHLEGILAHGEEIVAAHEVPQLAGA